MEDILFIPMAEANMPTIKYDFKAKPWHKSATKIFDYSKTANRQLALFCGYRFTDCAVKRK